MDPICSTKNYFCIMVNVAFNLKAAVWIAKNCHTWYRGFIPYPDA